VAGGVDMETEIRSFDIKKLPYTVRFGLGSTEPIKRWGRFELGKSGDLYWTRAIDVRKDCDSTNTHTSIHESGEVHLSRYMGKGEKQKKVYSGKAADIGSTLKDITGPHQVECGNELLEPGYVYYGLPTLTQKDKKIDAQNTFVACLDEYLINSRLFYSFDLLPWTDIDKLTTYLTTKQNQSFTKDNPRCHVFTFRWGNVSAVVSIKFTGGDNPIDLQKVAEAEKNAHPLKRLFHHETLSHSVNLTIKAKKIHKRLSLLLFPSL